MSEEQEMLFGDELPDIGKSAKKTAAKKKPVEPEEELTEAPVSKKEPRSRLALDSEHGPLRKLG